MLVRSRSHTRRPTGFSVEGLAQMTAVGLGLPRETFTEAGKYGYDYSIGALHLVLTVPSALISWPRRLRIL
jgi:hypothetical protein